MQRLGLPVGSQDEQDQQDASHQRRPSQEDVSFELETRDGLRLSLELLDATHSLEHNTPEQHQSQHTSQQVSVEHVLPVGENLFVVEFSEDDKSTGVRESIEQLDHRDSLEQLDHRDSLEQLSPLDLASLGVSPLEQLTPVDPRGQVQSQAGVFLSDSNTQVIGEHVSPLDQVRLVVDRSLEDNTPNDSLDDTQHSLERLEPTDSLEFLSPVEPSRTTQHRIFTFDSRPQVQVQRVTPLEQTETLQQRRGMLLSSFRSRVPVESQSPVGSHRLSLSPVEHEQPQAPVERITHVQQQTAPLSPVQSKLPQVPREHPAPVKPSGVPLSPVQPKITQIPVVKKPLKSSPEPSTPVEPERPQTPVEKRPLTPSGVPLSPVQPRKHETPVGEKLLRRSGVPLSPVQPRIPQGPAIKRPLSPTVKPLATAKPKRPKKPVEKRPLKTFGISLSPVETREHQTPVEETPVRPSGVPLESPVEPKRPQSPVEFHVISLPPSSPTQPQSPVERDHVDTQNTPLIIIFPDEHQSGRPNEASPIEVHVISLPSVLPKQKQTPTSPVQHPTPQHTAASPPATQAVVLSPVNILNPQTLAHQEPVKAFRDRLFVLGVSAEDQRKSLELDDTPEDTVERLDSKESIEVSPTRSQETLEILDFDGATGQGEADQQVGLSIFVTGSQVPVQSKTLKELLSERLNSPTPNAELQQKIQSGQPQLKAQPVRLTGNQQSFLEFDPEEPLSVELQEQVDEFFSLERITPSNPNEPTTFILQEEPRVSLEVQDTKESFKSVETLDPVNFHFSGRQATAGSHGNTQLDNQHFRTVGLTEHQQSLFEFDPEEPLSVELQEQVDDFFSLERITPSDPNEPTTFILQEEPRVSLEKESLRSLEIVDPVNFHFSGHQTAAGSLGSTQPDNHQVRTVGLTEHQQSLLEFDSEEPLSVELQEQVDEFFSLERITPSDPNEPTTFILQEEPRVSLEVQDTKESFKSVETVDIDSSERQAASGSLDSTQPDNILILGQLDNGGGPRVQQGEQTEETRTEDTHLSSLQEVIESLMATFLQAREGHTSQQATDNHVTNSFHVTDGEFGSFPEASDVFQTTVVLGKPDAATLHAAAEPEPPTMTPADEGPATSLPMTEGEVTTLPFTEQEVSTLLPAEEEVTAIPEDEEQVTAQSPADVHATTRVPVEEEEVTTFSHIRRKVTMFMPVQQEVTTLVPLKEEEEEAATTSPPPMQQVTTLTPIQQEATTLIADEQEGTTSLPDQQDTTVTPSPAEEQENTTTSALDDQENTTSAPDDQENTTTSAPDDQENTTTSAPDDQENTTTSAAEDQENTTTSAAEDQENTTTSAPDDQENTTMLPDDSTTTTTTTKRTYVKSSLRRQRPALQRPRGRYVRLQPSLRLNKTPTGLSQQQGPYTRRSQPAGTQQDPTKTRQARLRSNKFTKTKTERPKNDLSLRRRRFFSSPILSLKK